MIWKNRRFQVFVAGLLLVVGVGVGVFAWLEQDEEAEPTNITIDGEDVDTELAVETVTDDISAPWGLEFLPEDGKLLVTENQGELLLVDVDNDSQEAISGIPEVDDSGQGGLLDVTIGPDFQDEPWVYLTYSAANEQGLTSTYVGRGQLDIPDRRLDSFEELYVAEPFRDSTSHYGSRVVIDDDGYLFVSIGDRGDKNFDDHPSQDTSNVLGATIRLRADGSIPEDNPFTHDPSVVDEIYSYGHRNVQGMAIHPETGELWQSEHGEEDGDEINIIEAGGNYGWPLAHTGCEYGTDTPVGDWPQERDDTINPVFYWECGSGGFPPAGMAFYDRMALSEWQNGLFVGGLASEYLAHFTVEDRELTEQEPLLADRGWRIRDVTVGGHDGALYVAAEGDMEAIVRIAPQTISE